MSLVFAALTPHSPLLVPGIAKENLSKLKKTVDAFTRLEEDLYLSHPEVIFVISPHEGIHEKAFVVNVHNEFRASFEDFGDLVTTQMWQGGGDFGAKIAHETMIEDIPVRLINEEKIKYGTSIPLMYLTSHLKQIKVVPIGYSELLPKDHLNFGELLKEIIMQSRKRIAVIASGDMSHCLGKRSPAPYSPSGKTFDEKIQELLSTRNTIGLSQLDEKLLSEAHECVYRSLLILHGILKSIDYRFENYCYEHPFGVGYLTGNFHL